MLQCQPGAYQALVSKKKVLGGALNFLDDNRTVTFSSPENFTGEKMLRKLFYPTFWLRVYQKKLAGKEILTKLSYLTNRLGVYSKENFTDFVMVFGVQQKFNLR